MVFLVLPTSGIYVCMYVCMYVCTYIHANTYTLVVHYGSADSMYCADCRLRHMSAGARLRAGETGGAGGTGPPGPHKFYLLGTRGTRYLKNWPF